MADTDWQRLYRFHSNLDQQKAWLLSYPPIFFDSQKSMLRGRNRRGKEDPVFVTSDSDSESTLAALLVAASRHANPFTASFLKHRRIVK